MFCFSNSYRKRLKAQEEGVTITPSIVPPLPPSEITPAVAPNDSKLPPGVSPELVLFCRKIYDFRSKKIQVPNKWTILTTYLDISNPRDYEEHVLIFCKLKGINTKATLRIFMSLLSSVKGLDCSSGRFWRITIIL